MGLLHNPFQSATSSPISGPSNQILMELWLLFGLSTDKQPISSLRVISRCCPSLFSIIMTDEYPGCTLSNLRNQIEVVCASITRLGNRLRDLEETPHQPGSSDCSGQLAAKSNEHPGYKVQNLAP